MNTNLRFSELVLKLKVKGCSFIFWNKTDWKRCYQVALQQVSSGNRRKESFVKRLAQTVSHSSDWDNGSASRTDWFYATVNLILLLVFLCFMLANFMCNKNLVIVWSTLCCCMNKSTQIYFFHTSAFNLPSWNYKIWKKYNVKCSEMLTFLPSDPTTSIQTSLPIVPSLTVAGGGVTVSSQCFQWKRAIFLCASVRAAISRAANVLACKAAAFRLSPSRSLSSLCG